MIDSAQPVSWQTLDAELRPFVARRVRPEDVDDVVQDVFLRLWKGVGALRQRDRLGPWVYRVARSAIGDHHRASARRPVVLAEDGAIELAETTSLLPEPPSEAPAALLVAAIEPFVASLPEPYREALRLTELGGLTQREAAARLGLSHSGMKSRVQRGRRMLREALEACCAIALDTRGAVVSCEPRGAASCACAPPAAPSPPPAP